MSEEHRTQFEREQGISSILETLGGTGVTQIFVHDITAVGDRTELATSFPGFDKYAERALLAARPDDLVCVLAEVDGQYHQFLAQLGIGPKAGNVIVASAGMPQLPGLSLPEALVNNAAALVAVQKVVKPGQRIVVNPYIVSPQEFTLATILQTVLGRKIEVLGGNWPIVAQVEDKHRARALALALGVPVPEGDIVRLESHDGTRADLTPLAVAIGHYLQRTGKVVVKGTHGFSGSSIAVVHENSEKTQKQLRAMMGKMRNTIYLVEVMLDVVTSPNILMHLEPHTGELRCVSATDQILSPDLAHQGNIYPSSAKTFTDMVDSAQRIARWLQAQGYCGLVGFDFGEYFNQETGRFEHFLAEVNPRTNAAAYPKFLMEHLNRRQAQHGEPFIAAFLSINVTTAARSFAELVELYGHLFFEPQTGRGLVPYNVGCLEIGRCSMALLGQSRTAVIEMYENFQALLAGEHPSSHDQTGKEQGVLS